MSLDDAIDALAFGSAAPKSGPCLGMYLGPETIYIAETRLEGGKLAVSHLMRVPVPAPEGAPKAAGGPATATLNTDFLMDNAKLSALIRQSMAQARWSTKDVMVTLSHHLGLLRYFTMPAIDRRFWKSAIPLEAKKYIPIPFDLLGYDYQVVGLPAEPGGRSRQGALIAVTQQKNVANITALLQGLDLNLVGMEVAPCSVLRVWDGLEPGLQGSPYGQVHFDGGNIRILVADKGFPVFFRELFLGASASLQDLRKIDLGGCVAFAQKQLGVGPLGQVRVSGTAEGLEGWREAFSQEAGVPAVLQDTGARLGVKGADWGGAAAIGASARRLRPAPVTLDLARVGKVSDDEHQAARTILAAAALLALWFLGMGLFRMGVLKMKARDLVKHRRDPEVAAVFTGKSRTAIEIMLKEMQAQADLLQGIGGPSVKATELIKDVVDSLPEKVWLTRLSLSRPLDKGPRGMEFALAGSAVAASLGEEQDLAFQFKENLIKSPVFGKTFPDVQLSVTGRPLAEDGTEGLGPEALARRLEGRTSFSLTASARKP